MEALLSIEYSGTLIAALHTLYDSVESHVRQLITLVINVDAYNSVLPFVLMKKLLKDLCFIIAEKLIGISMR